MLPSNDHVGFNSGTFKLHSLHFHHPSEHQIDGVTFPLEVQLEHRNAQGEVLMLSVLFQNGPANPFLSALPWHDLPSPKSIETSFLDVNVLMPSTDKYFWYTGSLSTP